MPELPEVETVMRGLKLALEGRRVVRAEVRRKDLRAPFPEGFARRLEGRRFQMFGRRAKYVLAGLDDGHTLLIHLGMTGRFTVRGGQSGGDLGAFYFEAGGDGGGAHDHVVLDLDDGARVVYTDPRRFGMMDLFKEGGGHKLLDGLGVEPLGNHLHTDYLGGAFAGKKAPLKAALLDQSIIAGLGNIYVCEALHRAGLSPRRKAGAVKDLGPLIRHIRDILEDAIRAGGSTLRDYAGPDGSAGAYQQRFAVYDREGEPCLAAGCGGTVKRIVQSGRSTFWCPRCQK